MSDLIWIGNTLYPRDFVILLAATMFVAPFVIVGVIRLIWKLIHRRVT